MHSIRSKITAITVVAILVSILSVFIASFLIIRTETDHNSVGMMNLIDRDTRKSLEKYFESIEHSVEVAANIATDEIDSVFLVECGAIRPDAGDIRQTPEQTAAMDDYLRNHCARIQSFFSGVADYTQGVTAYYYFISPEISENERGFMYRKIGKTGFIEQEPPDVLQLPIQQTLGATWYEAAVHRGRPVWVGPYSSTEQGDVMIYSYFVPIYKSGMLIGVMGMDIPCETLVNQIKDVRIYDTGYVCLVDENLKVIYHPDLPLGSDLDEMMISISPDMLKMADSGDALIRYDAKGESRQMSFSTLSNGMKLCTIAPAREINAPWIRLIETILMISGVILLLSAILVMFPIRAITRPLRQLTEASRQLADADYDVDLHYRGDDEIGTLTSAFSRMREQMRTYIKDLNHQVYHDRLTDLPNLRHFFTIAEDRRVKLIEDGQEPVMLYFDIIGLRRYNRQHSFEKGDALIANYAKILVRQFGDHNVCRLNGARFAAVTDEQHINEQLAEVLRESETAMDGDRLSVRIGVYPNRLETVDVNAACDRAKFAADRTKGTLATSITYFDEVMLKKGKIFRHIINNLDQALEEGWVQVYYQPIVRAGDGKICDEEALARWIDPELGFLSPADFIPALEESKLIYKLDLHVLDEVLKKMKRQAAEGYYVVPQSINLSRMDFESCDVVEEIRRRVDDAGIQRSMITVEITESVIGGEFNFMKEQIVRFQELGFPVWMDDFGSGYSSVNVLQQIHFDLIKFDMGFMKRFDEGDESKIILTELMNMAISLGMETVCEGVETAEQVEFLREIGCTRIQGYYYGKPLPYEEIIARVADGTMPPFENPDESEYYTALGRINLYDVNALTGGNDDSLSHYFNTLPMSIIEVNGTKVRYNRCNRSYRDFLERTLGNDYHTEEVDWETLTADQGAAFFRAVAQCGQDGNSAVFDERLGDGIVIHTLIRRVAVNPLTGTIAVAVAVLAVT